MESFWKGFGEAAGKAAFATLVAGILMVPSFFNPADHLTLPDPGYTDYSTSIDYSTQPARQLETGWYDIGSEYIPSYVDTLVPDYIDTVAPNPKRG
jgi:hypothetical protein